MESATSVGQFNLAASDVRIDGVPSRRRPISHQRRGKTLIPQSHDPAICRSRNNNMPPPRHGRLPIALTALRRVPQSAKQTARQGKRRFTFFLLACFLNFASKTLHQAIGDHCWLLLLELISSAHFTFAFSICCSLQSKMANNLGAVAQLLEASLDPRQNKQGRS